LFKYKVVERIDGNDPTLEHKPLGGGGIQLF